MEEKEYLEILNNAYDELPKVLYKKERFEIPKVKGKLIKTRTIIGNFGDIAKHFSRERDHFFKFFLKELGVRGEFNPNGELTLHSRFQPNFLNKVVEKYFKLYIQCPHCNSPDTNLNYQNNLLKCNACGHQENLPKI